MDGKERRIGVLGIYLERPPYFGFRSGAPKVPFCRLTVYSSGHCGYFTKRQVYALVKSLKRITKAMKKGAGK